METDIPLIKRILFATDFSACAEHAEGYVAHMAKTYRATVDVLHVLEIYEGVYVTAMQDQRETNARLTAVAQRLQHPTVPVTHQQRAGFPDVLICEIAMETHADLIVLGTHGRTGLQHILLGSTAERVLTMAPCPVLTIRQPTGMEEPHVTKPIQFKQVLVPIDFSACSLGALEYGIQLAKDFSASMTLLHVLEPVAYGVDLMLGHPQGQDREETHRQFKRLVNMIRDHGVSLHEIIRGGLPADSILGTVHATNSDLVVMGTHGRRGISHIINGSVAEAVLRQAPCPVLAMKKPAFASNHQRVAPRRMESTDSAV
jgi:nucleotide-binding universal stress UspA family protein